MDLQSLAAEFKNMSTDQFLAKLHNQLSASSSFNNLGTPEKKILDDLIRKYKDKLRTTGHLSYEYNVVPERQKLKKEQGKLGLSDKDIEDIIGILKLFVK